MAVAGKKALVKMSGTGIAFTAEAFTTLTANTVYQITSTIKRVWDPFATITIKKDGVAQATNLYTINRLNGTVTFLADIGAGHTITADGTYLPMTTILEGTAYSWELTANYPSVAKFGDVFIPRNVLCLRDGKGSIKNWRSTDETLLNAVLAGVMCMFEFYDDSSLAYDMRIWGIPNKESWDAAVQGLVNQDFTFECSADADLRVATNV